MFIFLSVSYILGQHVSRRQSVNDKDSVKICNFLAKFIQYGTLLSINY